MRGVYQVNAGGVGGSGSGDVTYTGGNGGTAAGAISGGGGGGGTGKTGAGGAGVAGAVKFSWTISTPSYTLTYTAGAGGTISGTSPQTVNYGTNGTTVTAVPNTGYSFVQWSHLAKAWWLICHLN